jgi:hypothetical protein
MIVHAKKILVVAIENIKKCCDKHMHQENCGHAADPY